MAAYNFNTKTLLFQVSNQKTLAFERSNIRINLAPFFAPHSWFTILHQSINYKRYYYKILGDGNLNWLKFLILYFNEFLESIIFSFWIFTALFTSPPLFGAFLCLNVPLFLTSHPMKDLPRSIPRCLPLLMMNRLEIISHTMMNFLRSLLIPLQTLKI